MFHAKVRNTNPNSGPSYIPVRLMDNNNRDAHMKLMEYVTRHELAMCGCFFHSNMAVYRQSVRMLYHTCIERMQEQHANYYGSRYPKLHEFSTELERSL